MGWLPAPDRWARIAPLVDQALDLTPGERGAFLDRVCAGDPGLRAEIEQIVSADSAAGSFLGAPVDLSALVMLPDEVPGSSPQAPSEGASASVAGAGGASGERIGPYRIVREIGRGGMGVVYEAEQQQPRRPVALKVILGGRHADAEAVRLFRRETDSLARLRHPGIAAIYESGSTEGHHFFTMELVPGRTLSDHLEQSGPPASRHHVRRRLALFRKIAAAVSYAHQRGVIHRDLKPSNILVLEPAAGAPLKPGGHGEPGTRGAADEAPEIKVLDFGLARITDPDAEARTAATAIGRIQGTLPYMSPEQVRGRRDEVDVRTDVYSLGVILYRMLTGLPPYDLEGREFPEAARIVCEEAPRPLGADRTALARFDRDLSIIVLKALEKDPAHRYQGVAALDEDVARYLDDQPILARPPSAAYQIRKLVARHRIPFAAAGALALLLVVFATAVTLQARRITAERDRANREATTALRVSEFLTDLFKESDPKLARGNVISAKAILDKGVERIENDLVDEPEVQARLMFTMGDVYQSLGLYEKATPMLEKSFAIRRRILGEEHHDSLASMDRLAHQYLMEDRTAEAEALYERILEIRRRLQGEDHPETLLAMYGLAFVRGARGRHAEQEQLLRRVLEGRRRALGDEHPGTLLAACGLADSLAGQRRYEEAAALYQTTLETQRRVLGEDHPNTLETAHHLAGTYHFLGRSAEAEKLLRKNLEHKRRTLGEDNPYTLDAMNDLAVTLDSQGRYAEAEALLRETLARYRRVLGDDHGSTLSTLSNLANMVSLQGRYAEAEALLREALDRQRRVLGEDHPGTVSTLYNLGCTTALKGDRSGALDWLGQAVEHGWRHADQMARDADLRLLRGDPRFDALVARARRNPGR